MKNQLDQMKALVATMEHDMEKAVNGNYSAGTRVRSQCQAIKKLCGEIRSTVQEIRAAKKD